MKRLIASAVEGLNVPKSLASFLLAITSFGLLVTACGGGNDEQGAAPGTQESALTLRIAYSGDFSGPYALFEKPVLDGMTFAARTLNEEGGPVTVEIVSKDNRADTTTARRQTQEFIDAGVNIHVLTAAQANVAQGLLVSENDGLPLPAASTSPTYTASIPGSVLLSPPDHLQASVEAEYACGLGYRTVYMFSSPDHSYTKFLPDYFLDAFAHFCGGKTVGTAPFHLGQTDFSAAATRIQNTSPQPDLIYFPGFLPDSAVMLNALRAAGVAAPVLFAEGSEFTSFLETTGRAAEGVVMGVFASWPSSPDSEAGRFERDFAEVMGHKPTTPAYEAIGRDHVFALAHAAEEAGSVEPDALREVLLNLTDFNFIAAGTSTMDPETRMPKEMTMGFVTVKDGKFTFLTSEPSTYVPEL
jgi:branched-chain amino acid transport system substrate-binding protein